MLRNVLLSAVAICTASTAEARGFHAGIESGVDNVSDGEGESATGAVYGATFGYDVDRGGLFYGVELTAAGTSTRACRFGLLVPGDRACIRSETDSALVARAGAILARNVRIYGLAGFASTRVQATYRVGAIAVSERSEPDGLRLGAGVELPLSRRIAAKFEYRYSNLDDGLNRHQGVGGLSFRF